MHLAARLKASFSSNSEPGPFLIICYWGLLDVCHHLWTGALAPSIDKQRREGMNRYYKYGCRLSRGPGVWHRHWSAIDESGWIFAPKIVWSESCLSQQSACWPCRMSRSQRFTRCFISSDWQYSAERVLYRSCPPRIEKLKVLPLLPRLFCIMWRYQNSICHRRQESAAHVFPFNETWTPATVAENEMWHLPADEMWHKSA